MEKAVLKLSDGLIYIGEFIKANQNGDITIKFEDCRRHNSIMQKESIYDLTIDTSKNYSQYQGEMTFHRESIIWWYKK